MLSNTDFVDLLKSGASNGLTADGKRRFGLEQIKTWDKQNNTQGKKKPSSFGKTPARGGTGDEATAVKPEKYRDRAVERREDVVTSEEAALEAVVSKLDAGTTFTFISTDIMEVHVPIITFALHSLGIRINLPENTNTNKSNHYIMAVISDND